VSLKTPLLLAALAAAPPLGTKAQQPCSTADAQKAEETVGLSDTWQALHEHYKRYRSCDDGAIAEGYSDAVVRLLANKWEQLSDFEQLAQQDPEFERWALRHVDATTSTDDLERAWRNAHDTCPRSRRDACLPLVAAIREALTEQSSFLGGNETVGVVGVLQENAVRVAFRATKGGWRAFPSPDIALSGTTVATAHNAWVRKEVEKPFHWNVCFDGKRLGTLETQLHDGRMASELGVHRPSPGQETPSVGKPSREFGGWDDKPVQRPLVLTTTGTCEDPDQWHRAVPPKTVVALAAPMLRRATSGIFRCNAAGESIPYDYLDSKIVVGRSYVSAKGDRIVTLSVNRDVLKPCPFEMIEFERPWMPHSFAVRRGGEVVYLGSRMALVEAGDFDGDGKSELVFKFQLYDHDGYTLFSDSFGRSVSYGWIYH
jgi:hypothetical protein